MLLGWCTRIGWALAQRSNGPGCSVAHVSCFAHSPTLCRKCYSRVYACGVKNAGYHSPSSCRCKKIARMSCSAYERGSSTLSFTRNAERNTPRPLSPVSEQRMTVLNFWRSAFVWSVAYGATCNKGICRAAEDCCGSKCDWVWIWFSRIWGLFRVLFWSKSLT